MKDGYRPTDQERVDMTMGRILATLKARDLPVNESGDPKGIGLTVSQDQTPIFEGTGRRRRKIARYEPSDTLSILYNHPVDAQGDIITFGLEHVYIATLDALEELGLEWSDSPFGLTVQVPE